MKKIKILSLILTLVMLFGLCACNSASVKTNKSFTFDVSTGDKVELELDTTDGYDLTSDLPFEIKKGDERQTQGIFISTEDYDYYLDAAKTDDKAKVIEESTKGDIKYLFYSYDNQEWNYVIFINDSSTGILLGNIVSEESAKTCFDRLTITLEK